MNAIDLFWITFFVGGGVLLGSQRGPEYLGGIFGRAVGYGILVIWANANSRQAQLSPKCVCGVKDWKHYTQKDNQNFGSIYESDCGLHYVQRKGHLWFLLDNSGVGTLAQIKPIYRDWRKPSENEIANKQLSSSGE